MRGARFGPTGFNAESMTRVRLVYTESLAALFDAVEFLFSNIGLFLKFVFEMTFVVKAVDIVYSTTGSLGDGKTMVMI